MTYAFSSLYLGMHSAHIRGWQDNRHLTKGEMIHKHRSEAFFINPAALSSVNTFCISLFLFARQCSVAASGACLQSNRLSPLFLCFLSVLSDRRQGWRMSATSNYTEVCRLMMLVSSGTSKTCHFSSRSQNLCLSVKTGTQKLNTGLQLIHFNFLILFGKKLYCFSATCI